MPTPLDFRLFFKSLENDVSALLANDPTAINGLLFRARRSSVETLVPAEVVDNAGSIEASEKIFTYEDPIPVKAKELPIEFPVDMETFDEHGNPYTDSPVAMILSVKGVPKGSVLLYDEYDDPDATTPIRHILYVERSAPMSKHSSSVSVYYMLPFMDYETEFINAD